MKVVAVCVRDVRANVFFNPIFVNSIGAAMRQFEDEINRPAEENLLYKHPEDFELYELGTFDPVSAEWELLSSPRQLTVGSSCVRSPQVRVSEEAPRGNGKAAGLGVDSVRPV